MNTDINRMLFKAGLKIVQQTLGNIGALKRIDPEVAHLAVAVWGSELQAARWLLWPNADLKGLTPLAASSWLDLKSDVVDLLLAQKGGKPEAA